MRRLKFLPLLALCLLFTNCAPTIQSMRTDPKLDWHTLETQHFKVHYYNGLERDAQRIAHLSEEIYGPLSEELRWKPWGKIQVAVADVQDQVEDYATVFPYPEVLVFLARPGPGEGLSEYDDWLRLVLTHELTHIFHLDMAGGIWQGLRYVFGRTILPNAVTPVWISEGYAVFEESDKTSAGRLRSPYVDMVLRMDILENHWPPIDTLVAKSGKWPYGAQAYYNGGRFLEWIAKKHPKENFAEFAHRYGTNPLNFFVLEWHAKQIYGATFPTLYSEFREDMQVQYEQQKKTLEAKGLSKARQLTFDHEMKSGLVYSPDGKSLLYSASNGDTRSIFYSIDIDGRSKAKVVKYDLAAADFTWDTEHKSLYYSKNGKWRDYYVYSGMNEFDWSTKKITPVKFTGGPAKPRSNLARDPVADTRRTFNPNISSSGTLVYIVKEGSDSNIWTATPNPQGEFDWAHHAGRKMTVKQITQSPAGTEFSQPRWSPDGKTIAVSMKDPLKGLRDIALFSPEGKLQRTLTQDDHDDFSPVWSPDGQTLYFISDRSGVYNLYAYKMTGGELLQVTNVLGGVFSPAISPDGKRLAFLGYGSLGFDVYEMPLDNNTYYKVKATQAQAEKPTSDLIDPSNDTAPTEAAAATATTDDIPSKPYSPYSTLFVPRYISPLFEIVDDNDFYIGATIGSSDAIRRHTWSLSAYYRTDITEPGGAFTYSYTGWYPELRILAYAVPIPQAGILYAQSPLTGHVVGFYGQFKDGIMVQRDLIGKAQMGIKVPIRSIPGLDWIPGEHTLFGGYMFVHRQNISDINPLTVQFQGAPNRTPVFIPTEYDASGLTLDYSFSSAITRKRGISPTGEINTWRDFLNGYTFAAGYQFFNTVFGGNWNQQVLKLDLRQYRRVPFTKHHVIALRGTGGFTFGDDPNPPTFNLGGAFSEGSANSTTRNFYPLRGFSSGSFRGERFFLLSTEYRFPIWLADRGISTLPLYLKNISGAFFMDYGEARDQFYYPNDGLVFNQGNMGIGGELRAEFNLFYNYPLEGRLGYGIPVLRNKNASFNFTDGQLILNLGTTF